MNLKGMKFHADVIFAKVFEVFLNPSQHAVQGTYYM